VSVRTIRSRSSVLLADNWDLSGGTSDTGPRNVILSDAAGHHAAGHEICRSMLRHCAP
jgi:hypothetical protein